MNTVTSKMLLSADEFSRLPNPADGSRQELVRGEVETMPPPGFEHGAIQLTIAALVREFAKANDLGRVTVESGVKTERRPDTVRGPDISFWSFDRLPADVNPRSYPDAVPDLCIEVRSPDQNFRELRLKAQEYLRAGVRLAWIVDPEDRSVTIFREPDQSVKLFDDQKVKGEDVLPGFECAVSKFFE